MGNPQRQHVSKVSPETLISRMPAEARSLLALVATRRAVKATAIVDGKSLKRAVARARHEWWALLWAQPKPPSLPDIGNYTGHHHTTVLAGINAHNRLEIAEISTTVSTPVPQGAAQCEGGGCNG